MVYRRAIEAMQCGVTSIRCVADRHFADIAVRNAINKYSLMLVNKDTQIKLSALGERAGVMGACLLARSKSLGLL